MSVWVYSTVALFIGVTVGVLIGWAFLSPSSNSDGTRLQEAEVVRVIDGDTIETDLGIIRYVGIDTPETVHPDLGVECFGPEASDRNRQLLQGKKVKLLAGSKDQDGFGRKLRYVFTDGVFLNAQLTWEGFAQAQIFDPDDLFSQVIVQMERSAKESGRGGWSGCDWE